MIVEATRKPANIQALKLKPHAGSILRAMKFMGVNIVTDSCSDMDAWESYCSERIEVGFIEISTTAGAIIFWFGDYIIRDEYGGLYPCKPDLLHETYDIESTES